MTKKTLILYVSYSTSLYGDIILGNTQITVTPMQWLFPIITHQTIIKILEKKGHSNINILSVLRSYK